MATDILSKPSFSRWRKWRIGFQVFFASLIVLAVVVMVNYLSGRYFQRFYLSSHTRIELSPQTVNLLKTLTNQVQVTLYYDKDDSLYGDIADLLRAYSAVTPKIAVSTVDYYSDPGTAEAIRTKYHLGYSTNKNVVIFDCGGKVKVVPGNVLAEYTLEQVPNATEREFRRKPTAFNGEVMFTSVLLAITNPKPLKAYFLQGHGEPSLNDSADLGYSTFASLLRENYVDVQPLSLLGTNSVPADCNLLIVAGPAVAIPNAELKKIGEYLDQSGRLLALFNAQSASQETGLEEILAKWGVKVWPDVVVDPDHMANGRDIVISAFAEHPVVSPIIGSGLYMTVPRPVSMISTADQGADAPKVAAIAFTGEKAYLYGDAARQLRRFPVMVAVEQGAVKGVVTERGTTRMIIAGDSFFLNNNEIKLLSNRDFVSSAINWLLDRTTLLHGLGPRPITEFRVLMTKSQLQATQWILLGAMPGAALLLGGLVWLRRRR